MFHHREESHRPVRVYCVANARCSNWILHLLAIIKEGFLLLNLMAGLSGGYSAHLRRSRGRHDHWFVIHAMVAIDPGLRVGPHRRRIGNE